MPIRLRVDSLIAASTLAFVVGAAFGFALCRALTL